MRAFLLLMLFCASANAEMLGKVEDHSATIELHSDKGICAGEARRAMWVPKDTRQSVIGCRLFSPEKQAFQIAFLDGDMAQIPMAAVKRPEKL
jgi:hypothetical protein